MTSGKRRGRGFHWKYMNITDFRGFVSILCVPLGPPENSQTWQWTRDPSKDAMSCWIKSLNSLRVSAPMGRANRHGREDVVVNIFGGNCFRISLAPWMSQISLLQALQSVASLLGEQIQSRALASKPEYGFLRPIWFRELLECSSRSCFTSLASRPPKATKHTHIPVECF